MKQVCIFLLILVQTSFAQDLFFYGRANQRIPLQSSTDKITLKFKEGVSEDRINILLGAESPLPSVLTFIKRLADGTFCVVIDWYDGIAFLKFSGSGEWLDTRVYDAATRLSIAGIAVLQTGEVAVTGTARSSNDGDSDIFYVDL